LLLLSSWGGGSANLAGSLLDLQIGVDHHFDQLPEA
jgi:hypothetical protein